MNSLPKYIFYPNISTYIPIAEQSYNLILLWTDLFSNVDWHQPTYFNQSIVVACSTKHVCRFTRDRNQLSQASTIGFHLYDLNRYHLPERANRSGQNQTWIFITGESPVNFYYQNPSFSTYLFDMYFDRSISYKYDSPYSIFAPQLITRNSSFEHEKKLNLESLKLKKKAIAWIVSNCATFSRRENYVDELKKYISVDIFGRCGQACEQRTRQCQMNLDDYYFYLSFENSRCNSYITEKFWNIILDKKHRLVPIVMGGIDKDYERIAPKHSFINVNQFKSPEELAKYLHSLIQNPMKYLEYLQWREYTQLESHQQAAWTNFLCPLCEMSYDKHLLPSERLNFSAWFNPSTECHPDDVQLWKKCKQTTLNTFMGFRHRIKCP